MNTINIKALAIAVSLAFSAGAMAQTLTKSEYQAGKDKISAEYHDRQGDVHFVVRQRQRRLRRRGQGPGQARSGRTRRRLPTQREERVQGQRGQGGSGLCRGQRTLRRQVRQRQGCLREGSQGRPNGRQGGCQGTDEEFGGQCDGQRRIDRGASQGQRDEVLRRARMRGQTSEADYTLAKEKCETFAGGAKDTCLDRAKTRFGKS